MGPSACLSPATLAPAVLLTASITNALVTLATHIIRDLGVAGVALLNLCSGVIGVPGTEPTMLFAGFNVYQHHLGLAEVIGFGALGDVAGATIAYGIGYLGQREWLERHAHRLHLSESRLERTHRWFARFGAPAVLVSRVLPFIRFGFPYVAGVARMPYSRFLALAAVGSVAWMSFLTLVGRAVGSQWVAWRRHLEYVDYVLVAIVLAAIGYLLLRWLRGRRHLDAGAVVAAEAVEPDTGGRR
jgi:membrane protein DedA with SNARE-associated domain